MALGVCLLFDDRGETAIRQLWDRIEAYGIPTLRSHTHGNHHAHLSYTVLVEWQLDPVREALTELGPGGPIELSFQAVGVFPRGRISLIPAVPPELLSRQRAVNEAVTAAGATVHRHYRSGRWLPHSSLAPRARLSQLPEVAAAVNDLLPLTVSVPRAGLIDAATGRLWPLRYVP
ncbi:MAG: 2'-5' RNA ligase family protein [Micromonosporaceae bacterium]